MKIFVLLSRFPYPLEKGDKLRAFHQIKELSKNNRIYLCALSDVKVDKEYIKILSQYCEAIDVIRLFKWKIYWRLFFQLVFTDKSLQVAYFYDKAAQKKINLLLNKYLPDHIYCQLIRVAEYVRDTKIPKTLDYMDALARGMERRAEKAPFYLKPFLSTEAIRLKRYEHFIFDDFDNRVIISNQDRKLIVNINNDKIHVAPNGVDYATYKSRDTEKVYDLIFSGNMSYPPNVDSVVYLVKHIMPGVWKEDPNVTLVIVGAKPSRKVMALRSSRVEVTGWVEDIATYYAKSKIFVAPMQIGTGLQNKLLEAMAMKLPCVTSPLVNNALEAADGTDILVGNSTEEYVAHVNDLLKEKQLREHIAEQGHAFVKKNYTWERSTAIIEKLITITK